MSLRTTGWKYGMNSLASSARCNSWLGAARALLQPAGGDAGQQAEYQQQGEQLPILAADVAPGLSLGEAGTDTEWEAAGAQGGRRHREGRGLAIRIWPWLEVRHCPLQDQPGFATHQVQQVAQVIAVDADDRRAIALGQSIGQQG